MYISNYLIITKLVMFGFAIKRINSYTGNTPVILLSITLMMSKLNHNSDVALCMRGVEQPVECGCTNKKNDHLQH